MHTPNTTFLVLTNLIGTERQGQADLLTDWPMKGSPSLVHFSHTINSKGWADAKIRNCMS